jgi:hypothetical protein
MSEKIHFRNPVRAVDDQVDSDRPLVPKPVGAVRNAGRPYGLK